ncbi:MAG: hypothetical protein LBJ23_05605 [Tannerella sp.]|nr:hypothetical protein [Tannerella sp.]
MADLAFLPLWYGEAGDYVLVDRVADVSDFLSTIPYEIRPRVYPVSFTEKPVLEADVTLLEAASWGLSPQSIHLFETLRQNVPLLSVPRWDKAFWHLTHRHTAIDCLQELSQLTDVTPPQIFTDINDVQNFITTHPQPCIVKTPFSCSGRGVRWIQRGQWDEQTRRWVSGALGKQQSVGIETALNKVCDFAMEFESDGDGHVVYSGLSVFETSADGAYSGNMLGEKNLLEKRLTNFVPGSELDKVREAVCVVLAKKIGVACKGLLGVDMLIYRQGTSFRIHPFIELNLRRTMGHVCLQLGEQLIYPSSQGRFVVVCQPAGEAFRAHLQMVEMHPLQIAGDKIRSGYFSLCPVTPATKYRAYVEISSGTK